MRHARSIAAGLAAVSMLVFAGVSAAQLVQQQPTPSPTPSPAPTTPPPIPTTPPATPLAPGAVPPSPTREEEPTPPPVEVPLEPPIVPEDLLRSREPGTEAPRVFVGPDLFNPPAHQGWLTITPSLTVGVTYNDNLFLTGRNRRDEVVFSITPGVTLTMRRPNYRFAAGLYTSGEIFVSQSDLSDFGKSTRFFADWFYQISPTVTFTLRDEFVFSRDSNTVTTGGVSAGLQDVWRNTLTPSLRWQATPNTGFGVFASHTIIRLEDNTIDERDSDTFRLGVDADHRITARLTGLASLEGAYLDVSGEPSAWTVTPRVGLRYDVTPTLRVFGTAGPSFLERDGDTSVTPAITVGLIQTFKYAQLQVGYDRAVVAETIGVSDRHAVFGTLLVPTLIRRLQLEFTPRYTIVEPEGPNSSDTINTFSMNLLARYRIVRNISAIASYTLFHQTFERAGNPDITQNRLYFGLQYAYPISIY